MGTNLQLEKECPNCGANIFLHFGRSHNYQDDDYCTENYLIRTVLSYMSMTNVTMDDIDELKVFLTEIADDFMKVGRSEVIEELKDEYNKFKIGG